MKDTFQRKIIIDMKNKLGGAFSEAEGKRVAKAAKKMKSGQMSEAEFKKIIGEKFPLRKNID